MGARPARLKTRAEFLAVAGTRRRTSTPGLVLQVRRRAVADDLGPRLGLTVTKKVGNAVERNRVRRRLRAAAEAALGKHGCSGHDYVVIGRRGTLKRPFAAIMADLAQAMSRLGAFRQEACETIR